MWKYLAWGWTLLMILLFSLPGSTLPEVGFTWADKVVHALLFLGFAFLWLRALGPSRTLPVLIAGLLLAFGSEIYQTLLPWERTFELGDALADTVGLLLGWVLYRKISKKSTFFI